MIKMTQKTFYITGEISLTILTVLSRAVFKTQPEVYGGAFLQKS